MAEEWGCLHEVGVRNSVRTCETGLTSIERKRRRIRSDGDHTNDNVKGDFGKTSERVSGWKHMELS